MLCLGSLSFFNFFLVCLLLTFIHVVLSKTDTPNRAINESPIVQLSVYPHAGALTENIQVRCQISQPSLVSPLSSSKLENVYLSVKTDNVKPSGIVLMFDDGSDGCRINRENVHIDICNASLILIHINHTLLNETLQNIDYSCSKGTTYAYGSYRIISKYFSFKENKFCVFFLNFKKINQHVIMIEHIIHHLL